MIPPFRYVPEDDGLWWGCTGVNLGCAGYYGGMRGSIAGSTRFYWVLLWTDGGVSRNRPEVNSNHARIEWSTNRRVTPIPIGEDPRMTRALEGRFLTG